MSVDDVGSLSQANVSQVELGEVLRLIDLVSVQNTEAALDHVDEASFAVLVVVADEALDDADQHALVVGGAVADELLDLLGVALLELLRALSGGEKVRGGHGAVLFCL